MCCGIIISKFAGRIDSFEPIRQDSDNESEHGGGRKGSKQSSRLCQGTRVAGSISYLACLFFALYLSASCMYITDNQCLVYSLVLLKNAQIAVESIQHIKGPHKKIYGIFDGARDLIRSVALSNRNPLRPSIENPIGDYFSLPGLSDRQSDQ